MSEARSLIDIRNATVYRGTTKVFDRLSLSIDRECSTAILGPNGAGKTTLLRLIARDLYPVAAPDSYVKVLGRERWVVADLRHELGVVSPELQATYRRQVKAIDVVLSGFFGSIGMHPHLVATESQRERAYATAVSLQVDHLVERSFVELSEGEQRRFLLARALVNEPHSLLLDEPTSGLDLQGAFQLLAHLRELLRDGTTLVLVTHHVYEIPPEIARVVLLKEGRVFAEGEKAQVLSSAALSELFEVGVNLVEKGGFYQALPA